jgi:RimJ/RimL family protein N-acetyltransferase
VIQTAHQDLLARWLCERIGYMPTPHLRCIANVTPEGRILGVVGFDGFNGSSAQMHVAGEGNWVCKDLIRATFEYAFDVAGLKVLLGFVSSDNARALRFNRHVGFIEIARIADGHPAGELVVMELRREKCRFWREHGQEIDAAAA